MLVSKFIVGLLAALMSVVALSLAWQIHTHVELRAAATKHSVASAATVATFEQQLAAESKRLATAEATLAALLKTAEQTRSVPLSSTSSVPARALDAGEVAQAVMARAAQLIKERKPREALEEYVQG